MIIESIEIENYRQYKGPINLKFSLDKDRNFTIVKGTNGAGKTNLLNAITWCLYEEELHKTGNDDAKGPIYNLITKNQLNPGEDFDVKVKLNMIDSYGIKTSFKRSINFKCENNGKLSRFPYSKFEVKNDLNRDTLGTPELFIEKNMPHDIEGYFFFDGEKLEDYFDENSDKTIKNSVYQLSQLHLLDSALSNLNKVKNEYTNEIKKIDKQLGSNLSDRNNIEAKLMKLKIKISNCDESIENIESELIIFRDKLKKIDNKDKDILGSQKKQLIKHKKTLIQNIVNEKESFNKLIINRFPFILGYSSIEYAFEKLNEVKIEDISEDLYSEELLKQILDNNKCICGCDLLENKEALNKINDLLNNFNNDYNISREVKDTLRDLNVLKIDLESVPSEIKYFKYKINDYESNLIEVQENIEVNQYNLDGINVGEINKLNKEIKKLENKKDYLIGDKTRLNIEYEQLKVKLSQIIDKEKGRKLNGIKLSKYQSYYDYCSNAIEQIETLKSNVLENIRSKVEKHTSSQFKRLMWKDNFEGVLINKNYDVKLIDVTGNMFSPSILSAGEKLVLALSFVAALNNISGFDLPFIIDTPMGRLGSEMKINISKKIGRAHV